MDTLIHSQVLALQQSFIIDLLVFLVLFFLYSALPRFNFGQKLETTRNRPLIEAYYEEINSA